MQGTLSQSVTPEIDMTRTLFFVRQFLLKFPVLGFKVFNSIFKNGNLLMPVIRDQLKVLRVSIILFIFLATFRIFSPFMVNYLPRLKASPQCFSYYKAVFSNITFLVRHRVKEIISVNIDRYILFPSSCFRTPTIPTRMLCSTFVDMMTLGTPLANRFAFFKRHPTVSSAIWTSNPNILSARKGKPSRCYCNL